MRSHTVTAVLPATKREVFAYLSAIENLPEWATEFARELRRGEDGYKVINSLASSGSRSAPRGDRRDRPTRAIELSDRLTAYTFTMFQGPGMPDDLSESEYESLKREFVDIEARFS